MNKPSRRIVLTGFMGAGKTAVAESLAARYDCRMIDLDALITGREGRSIAAIIDKDGEARFREMETRALLDALQYKAAHVIALGGGTWSLERNRALVGEQDCITVWLDAPFELCWQRISGEGNPRPLARDQEETRRLYDLRRASYALATLRVEVARDNGIEDVSSKIIKALPK
jgi:shikimate kinase